MSERPDLDAIKARAERYVAMGEDDFGATLLRFELSAAVPALLAYIDTLEARRSAVLDEIATTKAWTRDNYSIPDFANKRLGQMLDSVRRALGVTS